jgi:hypothetical protein
MEESTKGDQRICRVVKHLKEIELGDLEVIHYLRYFPDSVSPKNLISAFHHFEHFIKILKLVDLG